MIRCPHIRSSAAAVFTAAALSLPLVSLLAGCASGPTPVQIVAAADSLLGAAVAGELAYESSPNPSPKIVAQIETYRVAADKRLSPLNAQIAAGTLPASTDALAAQAAVSTLTSYLTANGIAFTPPAG